MYIFTSDCVLNVELSDVIYVSESNILRFERASCCYELTNIPEDAMQRIALGIAEGKRYIEFEDATLVREEAEDEA